MFFLEILPRCLLNLFFLLTIFYCFFHSRYLTPAAYSILGNQLARVYIWSSLFCIPVWHSHVQCQDTSNSWFRINLVRKKENFDTRIIQNDVLFRRTCARSIRYLVNFLLRCDLIFTRLPHVRHSERGWVNRKRWSHKWLAADREYFGSSNFPNCTDFHVLRET